MESLERLLREHPLLTELRPEQVATLAGCVANRRFAAGEFLLREGDRHGQIFLLRSGTVAIEAASPGGAPVTVETLGGGEVLGVSWLTDAPSHFDCRARDVVIAFVIDQACLSAKMDADVALGYALASRLLELTYVRLARLRMQRLDLYR